MRGEDGEGRDGNDVGEGSPPHARGRQLKCSPPLLEGRITPACAGKTNTRFYAIHHM